MNNVRLQQVGDTILIDVVKKGEWVEVVVSEDNPQYKDLLIVSEVVKEMHHCKTSPKDKCTCKGCSYDCTTYK